LSTAVIKRTIAAVIKVNKENILKSIKAYTFTFCIEIAFALR
jgi:hypothetical protein